MAGYDLSFLFNPDYVDGDPLPLASSTLDQENLNASAYVEDDENTGFEDDVQVDTVENEENSMNDDSSASEPELDPENNDGVESMQCTPAENSDQSESDDSSTTLTNTMIDEDMMNQTQLSSSTTIQAAQSPTSQASTSFHNTSKHPKGFSFSSFKKRPVSTSTRIVPTFTSNVTHQRGNNRFHPYQRNRNSGPNVRTNDFLTDRAVNTVGYALGTSSSMGEFGDEDDDDSGNDNPLSPEEDEKISSKLKSMLENQGENLMAFEDMANQLNSVRWRYGENNYSEFYHDKEQVMKRLKIIYESLRNRPDGQVDTPQTVTKPLHEHQKEGLKFLLWRETQDPMGGFLADDMGLGKTLQIVALVAATLNKEPPKMLLPAGIKFKGRTLIVCPATLTRQWENEFKSSTRGGISVLVHHGETRAKKLEELAHHHVVITSYNLVNNDYKIHKSLLFGIYWKRIVLDEGHVIRNPQSQISKAVCDLKGKVRWILTGTPIHNRIDDIFPYLVFLKCDPFDDRRLFLKWSKGIPGVTRLHVLMKSMLIRRTKKELVEAGIEAFPEKLTETFTYQMEENEMAVYTRIMSYSQTMMMLFLNSRAERTGRGQMYEFNTPEFKKIQKSIMRRTQGYVETSDILTLLLRLRQLCCHPVLIRAMLSIDDKTKEVIGSIEDDDDLDLDEQNVLGDMITDALNDPEILSTSNEIFNEDRPSTKINMLMEILEKRVKNTQDKAVVISEWTSYLDIIGEHIQMDLGLTYVMYTGKVPMNERNEIVERFNNSKLKHPRILLLSLTAGGVGLNLTGANHVFLMTVHWNPQLEKQAADRVYRIGQKKNVHIYKFRACDTIEQRIFDLQTKKLELADKVIKGTSDSNSRLTIDDLKTLFGLTNSGPAPPRPQYTSTTETTVASRQNISSFLNGDDSDDSLDDNVDDKLNDVFSLFKADPKNNDDPKLFNKYPMID